MEEQELPTVAHYDRLLPRIIANRPTDRPTITIYSTVPYYFCCPNCSWEWRRRWWWCLWWWAEVETHDGRRSFQCSVCWPISAKRTPHLKFHRYSTSMCHILYQWFITGICGRQIKHTAQQKFFRFLKFAVSDSWSIYLNTCLPKGIYDVQGELLSWFVKSTINLHSNSGKSLS